MPATTRQAPVRGRFACPARRRAAARYGFAALALVLAAGVAAPGAAGADAPDLSAAIELIGAALEPPAAEPAAPRWPAPDSASRRMDYLWVVRWSLADSAQVERTVERALEIGVKGLLAQVVGRGDAYYRSDLLPRPESLARTEFDPLDMLVRRAQAAGLEVHAWVNCMLVWSLPHRPRDPRHVLNAHPEWVARLANGKPMTALTARQRRRLGVEGVFLSPAHPGVRSWLGAVVNEIAMRYPVNGVHLDYIRLPGVELRPDAGAADDGVRARTASRSPSRSKAPRTEDECALVSAVVGEVRDSLSRARPGLPLTAAVLPDTAVAERTHAQRWTAWLREGLIDRAFVMCYAPPVRTVVSQLMSYASSPVLGGRVIPGIAVYNTPPATAAAKIKAARALGFPELALYSCDALAERPGYWPRLTTDLDAPGSGAAAPGGPR